MEFYIIIDDKQMGPFGIDELKVRGLKPDTPVWAEGMQDWAKASEVPALEAAIVANPQPQQPPYYQGAQQGPAAGGPQPPQWQPPYPGPVAPGGFPPQEQPKPKNNRPWIITAIVVVILALLVFSCPDSEDHQEAVKSEVRAFVNESIDADSASDGILGSILSVGKKCLSGVALETFMTTNFHVDNYVVCSFGRVELGEKDKTVSFGILGHVFTFAKEDLALALDEAIGGSKSSNSSDEVQSDSSADNSTESAVDDAVDKSVEKATNEAADEVDSIANRFIDSVGHHIKKKATKAATDWLKKQVDKLNQ